MLAFKIIRAGTQAIAEIEGLRSLLFKGIFINYLIFICLTLALNGLFFFKFISPIIYWVFGYGEGFWASLGNIILWSIQLTFAAVITLISLRFSVEFMYLWNQCLVKKIILNFLTMFFLVLRNLNYKILKLKPLNLRVYLVE